MSNTIAQSLSALQTAKSNIATAIINKGGTVNSGDGFADFPSRIASIPSGGGGSATEPYVEYMYDENNHIVAAKMYGFTEIPVGAFAYQPYLASVDLSGNNITSVGDYAFTGCTALALDALPSGITNIGKFAFQNCANITLSALPSNIATIGANAFQNCTGITVTALPANIATIGANAFQNCTGITVTALPANIATIGNSAFNGCSQLNVSYLPASITSIGDAAFAATGIVNLEIACDLGSNTRILWSSDDIQKIWLRNTCTTITATSKSFGICASATSIATFYAEPSSRPAGWGDYFNYTGSSNTTLATVVYGQATRPW